MYQTSYDPVEYVTIGLPQPVFEVFRRRWLSHHWNCDRIMAAALLYFLEHTEPRPDMLRRLIEVVQGGDLVVPVDDVLELHRDAFFTGDLCAVPAVSSSTPDLRAWHDPFPAETVSDSIAEPAREAIDTDARADRRLLSELEELARCERPVESSNRAAPAGDALQATS